MLSPMPSPKLKQNSPIVFLKAPLNILPPFLTKHIKYCKIFIIYYVLYIKMVIVMKKDVKKEKYNEIRKEDIPALIKILEDYYKDAKCSLEYDTPLQLVVALILAAQCTDERVNKIVPILFKNFPDCKSLANANIEDIEKIVKPCGFYKNKAKSISETANIILNDFNGNVPNNMKDLCTLKGIGRKSSNIIMQECFGNTVGIAVDTHVTRISRKIGLSNKATPEKIEQELMKKVDKKYWNKINHIFVYHGRAICIARHPKCDICPVATICKQNK